MKALLTSGLIILLSAISAAGPSANRGGYSGGGSDILSMDHGTAWFLGTTPITYCIEQTPNFGLSTQNLQQEFESVAKQWRNYIQERQIHTNKPKDFQINTNFQYTGACKGGESLKLYFGVEPKEVQEAKKLYEKPYAFAYRQSYDVNSRMGKGFLWFAQTGSVFPEAGPHGFPNWTTPNTLHGMMLHEVGHMVGVGHVEGTIMRQSNMNWMQMMDDGVDWSTSRASAVLQNIDDQIFLRQSYYSSLDVPGDFSKYKNSRDEQIKTFKALMNREPVGDIAITLKAFQGYRLALSDQKGTEVFELNLPSDLESEFSISEAAFGINFIQGYNTTERLGVGGFCGSGSIKSLSGKVYAIHFSLNANGAGGPFVIKYIDGSQIRDLFVSKLKGSILK